MQSKLEIWCVMGITDRYREWHRVGQSLGTIGRMCARFRLYGWFSREAALWNAWRILGITDVSPAAEKRERAV